MEDPKDFSLLDDDDDVNSSPQFDLNFNIGESMASNTTNSNSKIPIGALNNDHSLSKTENSNNQVLNTIKIQNKTNNSITFNNQTKTSSAKSAQNNKYNISPNKPNSNTKLELKSIERPRSHSPLKMSGIEEYVQLYGKKNSIDNSNQASKITMNLKMDDLLANKNESSAYQMLSDFSVLTGDTDNFNEFGSKQKGRKKSLEVSNLTDISSCQNNDDDLNDDEDDDEDKEKRILNYKYTAVYKKDEATGAFEEKSKIMFEPKKGDSIQAPVRPKPPVPPPPSSSKATPIAPSITSPTLAKSQLEIALEALKNNSKNLENKLDKLDDITPSSNSYYDSSLPDQALPSVSGQTKSDDQVASISTDQVAPIPTIKKKNDSFFNEFLSKSDDLIAQTQHKLEKLSKLESVNKPLAPLAQSTPPPPKPKPTATIIAPPQQTQQTPSPLPSTTPIPSTIPSTDTTKHLTSSTMLNSSSSASINSSKSLIDLKSNENATPQQTTNSTTNSTSPIPNSQIDLLFDINSEQSFVLTSEPIKQGESYFDLLGLSNTNSEPTQVENKTNFNLNSDILDLTGIEQGSEINSNYSSTPFKDDLLELMTGSIDQNNQVIDTEPQPQPQVIQPIQSVQPSLNIDILITEPTNERDDNNVVPDGFFNLKHEIPYDQSRPHSPINLENLQQQQQQQFNAQIPLELDLTNQIVNSISNSITSPATSPSIVRSRPVSPTNRSARPPSPTALIKSRPSSPKQIAASPILENEVEPKPDIEKKDFSIKNNKNKIKKKIWTQAGSQGESTSSSSENDDDEQQKFQVRIRPKPVKDLNSNNSETPAKSAFIPLLPKPPKSAQEIEEFRLRRRSSDTGSITRSIKNDSSEDEEIAPVKSPECDSENQPKIDQERKDSVISEFNLELPDADDSLPLTDFNDKCELTKYLDGTYGCIVLVRQPFRNPNLLYKNAFQKMTEVRTWTECLVKLVDAKPTGKKLVFYNAHELISLATENETTVEKIIETSVVNDSQAENEKSESEEKVKKIFPFHEIELKTSYKFTDMCLQQFDNYTKIHTFKIQDIVFKETIQMRPDRIMAIPERFLKRFTKPKVTSLLDHTPLPFEICKFGHLSYSYLRSFLLLLQDAFWSLPTITRKKQREEQLQQIQQQPVTTTMSITAAAASLFSLGSNKQIQTPTLTSVTATHTREEITVKVVDEYKCKLDKDCRIREHKSRTRVFLIAFLNAPDPTIEVGLNDVLRHGKEIVGRYDIIPIKTEQWISPEGFEINERVVDKEEFEKTHCLRCVQMPDNLLVEIMRFRTRPRRNYELPLQVRCYMSVVGRSVEIRIECTVGGTYFTNLSDVHCEDIQIRFPLPDVWVYLFRVEKMFRYGAVHSTKHKLGKIKGLDRLLVHKSSHQGAIMEASCGMAKYEQAFKALVWRIEQLPAKNKDVYKTQLFICKLNLQEYDNFPEKYDETAQVQYSIPICASSKCQVRSVSVNTCDDPPEKWAKLKSKFEYDLDINYVFDQKDLPTVDKEKCAELQHLTQTESEGDNDNNEDDD